MRCWIPIFISIFLWAGASNLLAGDVKTAQGLYALAQSKERAKDYQGAIDLYQASTQEFPSYYWAYRQLGNCYYALGNNDMAVSYYDKYLAANPKDVKMRAFANQLRSPPSRSQATEEKTSNSTPWIFYADGGGALLGSSDFKKFGGTSTTGPDSAWAVVFGAGAAFEVFKDTHAFGRIDSGPFRGAKYDVPSVVGLKAELGLQEWSLLIGGTYSATMGRHVLSGSLGFGPAFFSGDYKQSWDGHLSATGGYQFSSMTWALEPGFNYDFLVTKHLGLRMLLAYRLVKFSTLVVTSKSGVYGSSTFANPATYTDGSQAFFDQSGLCLRVGLSWR